MIDRLDLRQRAVLALTALALLALVPGLPVPLRAVLAVPFFLVGPGLAWIRRLPVDQPVEQGAVAVAVSLTADVLVAEALLYAGVSGAGPVLAVLVALAAGGVLSEARPVPEAAAP